MGKKKETAIALATTTLAANVDVSKEDVVSVAVAQHDMNLEVAMAETKARLKELQHVLEDIRKQILEACQVVADNKLLDEAKQVIQTLIKTRYISKEGVEPKIAGGIIVEGKGDAAHYALKATCELDVSTSSTYYSRNLSKEVTVRLPANVRKLKEREDEISEVMVRTKERQVEIHKEQQNLHRIELRARAQLAQSTLEASPEGRQLLSQIQSVQLPELPALPAYKG